MLRRPKSALPAKWKFVVYLRLIAFKLTRLHTRKELMHLLHSRRKAEIEILSSIKVIASDFVLGSDSFMNINCRWLTTGLARHPTLFLTSLGLWGLEARLRVKYLAPQ